jgi:hypothetical protein
LPLKKTCRFTTREAVLIAVELTTPGLYCDVFDQLRRHNVRYVVVGGVATVMHGHLRPTDDLDIVVDPASDEAQRGMQALMLAGFMPSIPASTKNGHRAADV